MRGIFITFEGPDGAGKTTQLELLAGYLRKNGFAVNRTREPGGTELGDKIRGILLDPANGAMNERAEALLYMAARAQHVYEKILPALYRGEVVISDRYADSTIVYQGVARNLKHDDLKAINRFATAGVAPQLTILLDGDVNLLRGRLKGRGEQDRIESEGLIFHEKVRQGFLNLASAEPGRIKVIHAADDVDKVHNQVVRVMEEFLQRRACDED